MESNIVNTAKPSALDFILRNCWELLVPYLSNQDIGRLDLSIIHIKLRKTFFIKVSEFYLVNKIYSLKELEWILRRNITLTKCHLDFKGNIYAYSTAEYIMRHWYLLYFIQLATTQFIQD